MADRLDHDDLLALTAFIDGEAAASERARIAARLAADPEFSRLHTSLARLKACVGELVDEPPLLPLPMRRHRIAPGLAMAGLAAAAILMLQVPVDLPPHRRTGTAVAPNKAITLVGLEALVPDLGGAGLRLVDVRTREAPRPTVTAEYRGPRGCRVVLQIGLGQQFGVPDDSANRWTWNRHGLAYELTAFGMPADRFALIAGAARLATLDPASAGSVERLLRQARAGTPPCLA
jgi:anti-sigma factor RsiW